MMSRRALTIELAKLRADDRPTAGEIKDERRRRRDKQIQLVASRHYGQHVSGHGIAAELSKDLANYAASAWRFEMRRPVDEDDLSRRAGWWRILEFNDGEPLSAERIRKILGGYGS